MVPVAKQPQAVPAAAPQVVARPPEPRRRLVVLRGKNAGSAFRLPAGSVGAGSAKGLLLFPDDPFLAPLHATFIARDGQLFVRDEGGVSGIYVRIRAPERLSAGGLIAVGDHLVRFLGLIQSSAPSSPLVYGAPAPPQLYALEEILQGMRPGRACARPGPVLSIGRANCDLSFANDALLAPRHCEISIDRGAATLRDLGTQDGTFVRIPAATERALEAGDCLRLGSQVLRLDVE